MMFSVPVDSSWSASRGVIATSSPSGATVSDQTAGYRALECGEVQDVRGSSRTSFQAMGRGAPEAGTNVPAENGEAPPPSVRMR